MIYFDNAATTYPKPNQVIGSMTRAMQIYGANPGRAGHKLSMETAKALFLSRQKCADFFHADPENTCFTLNCTHALNYAIKGISHKYCHIITSDIEHNAVIRPVHALTKNSSCTYSLFSVSKNDDETLRNIERLITPRTCAVVCTAASNVTGQLLPYKRIGELCRRRNLCFILDTAQACGLVPITLDDNINIICAAGHKGLYGPMGTGIMITDGKYPLGTLIEGGTGSASSDIEQPSFLPDRFESGTINTPGAIALGAGVEFVVKKGIDKIYEHEMKLCETFRERLEGNRKIILYDDKIGENRVPVVSFNIEGMNSSDGAALLSSNGFYLRGGLHCAFLAHKKLGTIETGTIRFAPAVFNTTAEIYEFTNFLNKLSKK